MRVGVRVSVSVCLCLCVCVCECARVPVCVSVFNSMTGVPARPNRTAAAAGWSLGVLEGLVTGPRHYLGSRSRDLAPVATARVAPSDHIRSLPLDPFTADVRDDD